LSDPIKTKTLSYLAMRTALPD